MDNMTQSLDRKIEVILYFVAFFLALMLRFLLLGALPLGDLEATNALQALKLANGASVSVGGQPGYVALTSVLFFLFGTSGFWARIWPAVFGVGLIFVPLLFHKVLGRRTALVLTFFFAIEPGFTALSRTATGTLIGVVGLLAALGFLLNQKPVTAGVFTGLAFLGGTSFWPGLIGLVLSLGIFVLFTVHQSDGFPAQLREQFGKIEWKGFLIAAGSTLVLLGTMFFMRPAAISGLGTSLAAYFQSWKTGTGVSIVVMLLGLLGEQLMAIVLAFWGAVTTWNKRPGLHAFLGIWALVTVILTLLNPSRQVTDWVWTLIPLWALAALGLENLLQSFSLNEWLLKLFQLVATVAMLVFSYFNLISMVETNMSHASVQIFTILLPLLLLAVITFLVAWGWSHEAAYQGLWVGVVALLVLVTFGSAWKAGGLGPRPETELWRSDALPVGRDLTVQAISDLSLWNTGQETGIDVALLRQTQPSLQWALHDFGNLTQKDILGDAETPSIIITSAQDTLSQTQTYRGENLVWTSTPDFVHMTVEDWLKWYSMRSVPLDNTNILIWARNDLFKGS